MREALTLIGSKAVNISVGAMEQAMVSNRSLDQLSFLIGDWRGKGFLDYPGPPLRRSNYEILAMCKWSSDNTQLLFVSFNEDPIKQSMFHATQAFIYVDPASRQLRVKRNWLMDSENQGFVTIESLTRKDDEKGFGFTVVDREGVPEDFNHEGTINRVNDSEILIVGEARSGNRRYPYRDKLVRRVKPTSSSDQQAGE